MEINNLPKELLDKIGGYLNTKITGTRIPPQGMDSQVFFVTGIDGKEYAIKYGKNLAGDIAAYDLLAKNKIDIPAPKLFISFGFENKTVVILEKINYPLLESVPANQMGRYIPSMVKNLQKLHQIKSDKAGLLTESGIKNFKEMILSKFTGSNPNLDWKNIAPHKGLDKELVLNSVKNIIKKIKATEFATGPYSFLHTDFNQRNLFANPNSDEITGIIDWNEAMFGDPYNGLKKLDTNLAENRWKDMIKYDQKNATGKSAGCACRH